MTAEPIAEYRTLAAQVRRLVLRSLWLKVRIWAARVFGTPDWLDDLAEETDTLNADARRVRERARQLKRRLRRHNGTEPP